MDFLDLESIETALAAPDLDVRQAWAKTHRVLLAAMLESPNQSEVSQRLWRMRRWLEGDYEVVTLVQTLRPGPVAPGQQAPKVVTYIARGYHRATNGSSVQNQALFGDYSVDEIVAFLRLDCVDPDSIEWRDETRYSNLIVVGDVLKHMPGRLQD